MRWSFILPPAIRDAAECYFEHSFPNMQLYINHELPTGILARASGNEINFSPGLLSMNTFFAVMLLGHEICHLIQQDRGRVTPQQLPSDGRLEFEATYHGYQLAMNYCLNPKPAAGRLFPPLVFQPSSGLFQDWGVGGKLSVMLSKQNSRVFTDKAYRIIEMPGVQKASLSVPGSHLTVIGVHELLTILALGKLAYSNQKHGWKLALQLMRLKDKKMSLVMGSRWNDLYFESNLKGGGKIVLSSLTESKLSDVFLRESHYGSMQFLHAMDCSGGNRSNNYKKMVRWAAFCLDIFFGQLKTNMPLAQYVASLGQKDILRTMLGPLAASDYGAKKLSEFFGKNFYSPILVALGSVCHMLQDSFVDSHARRGWLIDHNKKTDRSGHGVSFDCRNNFSDIGPAATIKQKIRPIMLHANYRSQNGGRHGTADLLRLPIDPVSNDIWGQWSEAAAQMNGVSISGSKQTAADFGELIPSINFTPGAALALDCTAQFLYLVLRSIDSTPALEFLSDIFRPLRGNRPSTTQGGLAYDKDRGISPFTRHIVEHPFDIDQALLLLNHQIKRYEPELDWLKEQQLTREMILKITSVRDPNYGFFWRQTERVRQDLQNFPRRYRLRMNEIKLELEDMMNQLNHLEQTYALRPAALKSNRGFSRNHLMNWRGQIDATYRAAEEVLGKISHRKN